MILINVSSGVLSLGLGEKFITLAPGQESPSMIMAQTDVRRLANNISHEKLQFIPSNDSDLAVLSACNLGEEYLYNENNEKDEVNK